MTPDNSLTALLERYAISQLAPNAIRIRSVQGCSHLDILLIDGVVHRQPQHHPESEPLEHRIVLQWFRQRHPIAEWLRAKGYDPDRDPSLLF